MNHRIAVLLLAATQLASAQRDRFSVKGVQIGDTLPPLELRNVQGEAVALAASWKEKPALIVTGSLTCPIARRECPLLEQTLRGLEGKVNVVIVYTVEAHPEGDASPYGGRTDTPGINIQNGIIYGQPQTLAKRLELAREFIRHTKTPYPVLVDDLDNRAWQALGSGPNLAVLADPSGKVVAKQGWLDPQAMRTEIERLLQTSGK